jgi:hypothetical protein
MATPLAGGLFHRVIAQSGGHFDVMPYLKQRNHGRRSAEEVGVRLTDELLGDEAATPAAMRASSSTEVLETFQRLGAAGYGLASGNVDGWVFPDEVLTIFSQGRQHDVPVIVGSNADEGTALYGYYVPKDAEAYAAHVTTTYGELADDFLQLYPNGTDEVIRSSYLKSRGHWRFSWEMQTWARLMQTVSSDAYMYYFTHVPPLADADRWGAYHAAEILFAFANLEHASYPVREQDRAVEAVLSGYWTSFAATGDPNSASLPEWLPSDSDGVYMELGAEPKLGHHLLQKKLAFFDRFAAARRNPLAGKALFDDVKTYASFTGHRTASKGDLATSAWLADRLGQAGFEVELQEWNLDQYDLDDCVLTVAGESIECFPFWLPQGTEELETGALQAPVAHLAADSEPADVEGCIAYLDSESVGGGHFKLGVPEAVLSSGAVAAAVVIKSPSDELVAQNAVPPYVRQTLPLPAVIVGEKDEGRLKQAAQQRAPATLRVAGSMRRNAKAMNVIGRLVRGPKWIIVSTPISGWFSCGGERGPGVALWLAIAAWAAEHDSDTSFLLVATSGHELDNMGAAYFADSEAAPAPADVICWLHLGASIATRRWQAGENGLTPLAERNPGNLVGSAVLVPLLEAAFTGIPEIKPRSGESKGELAVVLGHGYRAFGLYGGHTWFHTPHDQPEATDAELLGPIARACVAALVASENAQVQP